MKTPDSFMGLTEKTGPYLDYIEIKFASKLFPA